MGLLSPSRLQGPDGGTGNVDHRPLGAGPSRTSDGDIPKAFGPRQAQPALDGPAPRPAPASSNASSKSSTGSPASPPEPEGSSGAEESYVRAPNGSGRYSQDQGPAQRADIGQEHTGLAAGHLAQRTPAILTGQRSGRTTCPVGEVLPSSTWDRSPDVAMRPGPKYGEERPGAGLCTSSQGDSARITAALTLADAGTVSDRFSGRRSTGLVPGELPQEIMAVLWSAELPWLANRRSDSKRENPQAPRTPARSAAASHFPASLAQAFPNYPVIL